MKRPFRFKWKLTENYFNALMVFGFTILVSHAIVNDDVAMMYLAMFLGVVFPFIATLIDMKSHEEPKN